MTPLHPPSEDTSTRTYEARGITADGREVSEAVHLQWVPRDPPGLGWFLITTWRCDGAPPEFVGCSDRWDAFDMFRAARLRSQARVAALSAPRR